MVRAAFWLIFIDFQVAASVPLHLRVKKDRPPTRFTSGVWCSLCTYGYACEIKLVLLLTFFKVQRRSTCSSDFILVLFARLCFSVMIMIHSRGVVVSNCKLNTWRDQDLFLCYFSSFQKRPRSELANKILIGTSARVGFPFLFFCACACCETKCHAIGFSSAMTTRQVLW